MFSYRNWWIGVAIIGLGLCIATVYAATVKVEIFSWWIGEGEEDGLKTLIKIHKQHYPGTEVNNAPVAGGGGINAKSVLQSRMVDGNPPDSFQVHGGAELIESYVKTGMMQPITDLVNRWGIRKRFNPKILEMCSYRGAIYSIPLNVHRGNILWYNKRLLEKYHLTPPKTYDSLVKACETLQHSGITPLALGDSNKWEATQLFETLVAMTLGPAKYNGLWNGKTSFDDPGLRIALERFKRLSKYVNKNHATLTWQGGSKLLFEGKAVFNVMGDWAEGYFKTLGWQPGKEFGWVALCGGQGNFMVITDTFGLPKGAPHQSSAVAWLKTVASVEGQDAFNLIKGSIPSRLDANRALYSHDRYLLGSMEDFAKLPLTPSIAHGSAVSQGFSGVVDDLLNAYIATGNTAQALKTLRQAAKDYLQ